jgi:hypothetical protein
MINSQAALARYRAKRRKNFVENTWWRRKICRSEIYTRKILATKREPQQKNPLILLTGASGYVGGRLLKVLEAKGYRAR